MPKSIGSVLAAVAATVEAHSTAVRVAEAAHQAAELADLHASHGARLAAIAEAEAVAVMTGRTVHDPATNRVYTVVGGKIVSTTPDSPDTEVEVPPVDIDGDGEYDNIGDPEPQGGPAPAE